MLRAGLRVWLLVWCGLVLFAPEALAQRRLALVVGNAAYVPSLRTLRTPGDDATDMTEVLTRLGFAVTTERDRTGAQLRDVLDRFTASIEPGDLVVLHYSGHGFSAQGANFLMGIDAGADTSPLMERSTASLERALSGIARRRATALLFFDACRTLAEDSEIARALARQGARSSMAELIAPSGMYVVFSTQPGNSADDGNGRNSPFTGALVRYLLREGAEIREVIALVRQQVLADTRGAQTPWDHGSLLPQQRVVLREGGTVLPAQSCSLRASLRSTPQGAPGVVTFVNRTRGAVRFARLDPHGTLLRATSLGLRRQRRQRTHAGAVWVVTNNAGACLGVYTATPDASRVNVDE